MHVGTTSVGVTRSPFAWTCTCMCANASRWPHQDAFQKGHMFEAQRFPGKGFAQPIASLTGGGWLADGESTKKATCSRETSSGMDGTCVHQHSITRTMKLQLEVVTTERLEVGTKGWARADHDRRL